MTKKVLHVSTECYPAAKAGGMADVVGALPIYQADQGWSPSVVIPKYDLPWFQKNTFKIVHEGILNMAFQEYDYSVLHYIGTDLSYEFYCIDIPELFERDSIYLAADGHGYADEAKRNIALQRCVLQWMVEAGERFDLLHCHDHQTGFMPFMIKHCYQYSDINTTKTVYTIHNGAYNSRIGWDAKILLPDYPDHLSHSIDWDFCIDAVMSAMRYADHINAVSPTNMIELSYTLKPLQVVMAEHPEKFSGILNGIDEKMWDPKTDSYLPVKLGKSWDTFKHKNKEKLIGNLYHIKDIPLISFIGRFAHQKGADLLIPAAEKILNRFGFVNFFILGSGDKALEHAVQALRDLYPERVGCYIGYNEGVAHQVYAASDFILMPSRFEPCGLNQMFAMRYGTLPVARQTGGLKDTVIDYAQAGTGISFIQDTVEDLTNAIARALYLYKDKEEFIKVRNRGIKSDYSWKNSAKMYADIYNQLIT